MPDTPDQIVDSFPVADFVEGVMSDLDALDELTITDDGQFITEAAAEPEIQEPLPELKPRAKRPAVKAVGQMSLYAALADPGVFDTTKSKNTGYSRTKGDNTPPEDDDVRLYLSDIGRHAMLTKHGEAVLNTIIKDGAAARAKVVAVEQNASGLTAAEKRQFRAAIIDGDEATKIFIQANLRLVVSIAKRYQGHGLDLLDLIQEGNLGMMHALEKFDHNKGFKFSTYASYWIKQYIPRGIAKTGRTIKLPVEAVNEQIKINKHRVRLTERLGRAPSLNELAEELKQDPGRVAAVLDYANASVSLSEPVGEKEDAELGDLIADKNALDPLEVLLDKMLPDQVDEMLTNLTEIERQVVRFRFGLDDGTARTGNEVAEILGCSEAKIREVQKRAMDKIRHPAVAWKYQDFLTAD